MFKSIKKGLLCLVMCLSIVSAYSQTDTVKNHPVASAAHTLVMHNDAYSDYDVQASQDVAFDHAIWNFVTVKYPWLGRFGFLFFFLYGLLRGRAVKALTAQKVANVISDNPDLKPEHKIQLSSLVKTLYGFKQDTDISHLLVPPDSK